MRKTVFQARMVPCAALIGNLLFMAGCSKNTEPSGGAASAVPTSGASGNPGDADTGVVLAELTQALRKYSMERRGAPKTLSEVVAAGYVTNMPEAPPGKKFEIDSKTMRVVLVRR